MRRKADREAQELDVEAQQRELGKAWKWFRITIAVLLAGALGAVVMAVNS